ncbi:class E sortase [Auraticoccus monumenti]|uniref:Sortase A n=1 Tax=Auraticoccus monumenti TaxID=675864 RepID=A0A1G7BQA2_9ACTN|nr:class E sortase [Auraticoccus monumenti]SDE28840.1 sortase A [Auraticoccus monumenti]
MSQDDSSVDQGPRPRRLRRVAAVSVLAVVAVAPWLVPWGDLLGRETAAAPGPSIVERATDRPASEAPEPRRPDAASVDALAAAVSGASGFDIPVSDEEVSAVSTEPGEYRELGGIEIPAIGLDVSYGEGVYEEALTRGPGHWPGTPMPGSLGNSVISGHRNTHTQPFKELDELSPGDEVVVDTGEKPTTFTVTETTIVPEAEYKEFVLRQPEDPRARQVTLFACHPEGNPIFRIVVQAEVSS